MIIYHKKYYCIVKKTVAYLLFILSNLALPIDCEWSPWINGECSSSGGGCIRTKTRSIKVEATHGGKCVGNRIEVAPCSTQSCPGKLMNLVFWYHIHINPLHD